MILERVEITKFLGVLIQENLNWNSHIDYICNKISRTTGILSRLKHYIPKYILRIIYNSLCMSYISYAVTVWGGSSNESLKRLKVLQKKGIRHVCNAKYNSHTDPLFKNCNILKFDDLNKLSCIKLMYKKTQGKIHKYHASKLKTNSQYYKIDSRQKHDVKIIGNKTQ